MTDRINAGWHLYQDGVVKFIREFDGQYEFEVSGSEVYDVYFRDGVWFCQCWDFKRNWEKYTGSFTCKHIIASIFKLFELFKLKVFVEATK